LEETLPKLGVVIVSVRVGRGGLAVAEWFLEIARRQTVFEVVAIDLEEVDLPLVREPNHPRLQHYTMEKTKAWSATVAGLDAFVFVTPEYNHGTPPPLSNALDYLYAEWNYKAVGFVSYGGISAGTRGVQMTKQILGSLKMVALVEAVSIPFYTKLIDADSGRFNGGEANEKAAIVMLNELARWTAALARLRS
jgi:NAD(P)H-dependent FMN reductase